jgi:ATP-dependent Lon protease
MPGKVIQSLKKAGSTNPVFLLDEIDKMSSDFRGDPSSAMLEVLDPEQNFSFNDHYLDLDYDLSDIMFIATANNLNGIPPPLLDRMEMIRLPGYTEDEKLAIATIYLIPKEMETNGLKDTMISFSDSAIRSIIRLYTREAGVRNLEREIANVCRKVARKFAEAEDGKAPKRVHVSAKNIHTFLGVPRFTYGLAEEKDEVGITTGLAWTEVGGETLQCEVTIMPGKGKLTITGKLGEVMQESAQAAMSAVRSRAREMGLKKDFFEKIDIHLHLPEGAIPKDGPSAGVTMATSITSALSRIPVHKDVAMTGEITLRGKVLAIGGLKEKLIAAVRGQMKKVLIPKENEKDLKDVPNNIKKALKIIPVSHIDEVLKNALCVKDISELYKNQKKGSDLLEIYDTGEDEKKETPPAVGEKTEKPTQIHA